MAINAEMQLLKDFVTRTIFSVGDAGLHVIDPDNFELYIVALEVRDEDDYMSPVKELLVFPVNPDSLMYIKKSLVSIKKSFTGVHVNDNETFVPSPINLNGTFGRKFRYVQMGSGVKIRTGFGSMKELQKLIALAKGKNESGKPYRTIFYCLPFSEIFTVEINECRYNQSIDRNRLWYYDLNMTAVAPGYIGSLKDFSVGTTEVVKIGIVNQIVNDAFRTVKSIITI